MNEIYPDRLAELRRRLAVQASVGAARASLPEMVADNDAEAHAPGRLAAAMFREQRSGTFRDGYVFRAGSSLAPEPDDGSEWGYWRCDVADRERLTWSATVHVLFGLPVGAAIDREWAVGRYGAPSQATLQRVREFALRHRLGFLLDAEIAPENLARQWIRILALPVADASGRIVRLHGLKRAL